MLISLIAIVVVVLWHPNSMDYAQWTLFVIFAAWKRNLQGKDCFWHMLTSNHFAVTYFLIMMACKIVWVQIGEFDFQINVFKIIKAP